MAYDLCGRITSKSYLNFLYTKSRMILFFYQKFSMTRYILTVGSSSTNQCVRVIPCQINMVKQVNIHVNFIEDRYICYSCLKLNLCTPFKGDASFSDPFCYLCFILALLCRLVCSLWSCGILLGWASLLCMVFS